MSVKWGVKVPLFEDGDIWVTRNESGITHIITYDKYEDAVEASKIWNKAIVCEVPNALKKELITLEKDLYRSERICQKAQNEDYAQALYAALCNNTFEKEGIEWSTSFRNAASIVGSIVNGGDYIDYYCGSLLYDGIRISEGMIIPEIKQDLELLGWYKVQEFRTL